MTLATVLYDEKLRSNLIRGRIKLTPYQPVLFVNKKVEVSGLGICPAVNRGQQLRDNVYRFGTRLLVDVFISFPYPIEIKSNVPASLALRRVGAYPWHLENADDSRFEGKAMNSVKSR
jgi:hypothetical protein